MHVNPARLAFATLFDARGQDPTEPALLFSSMLGFGGELQRARRLLYHVGSLPGSLGELLRDLDVELREVAPFDDRCPHANKLRMLHVDADVDVVLMLDTDIAVLDDPTPMLPGHAVGAKPVDMDPLSMPSWRALFGHYGLEVPSTRYVTCFQGKLTIPYFNSGVVSIPTTLVAELEQVWGGYVRQLLDDLPNLPAQVRQHAFHVDQFALALAVADLGLPHVAFPLTLNFPTNAPIVARFEPDAIVPRLLHHHHQIHADGTLALPRYAASAGAVGVLNAAISGGQQPDDTCQVQRQETSTIGQGHNVTQPVPARGRPVSDPAANGVDADFLDRLDAAGLLPRLKGLRWFLHSGTPKTGTSAIQRTFWQNRARMLEHGVLYPGMVASSADPRHQVLIPALRDGDASALVRIVERVVDELDECTDTVVMSAEGIAYQWPRIATISSMLLRTLASVTELHFLVALRPRSQFLLSQYKQALVNPPTEPEFGRSFTLAEFSTLPHVRQALDYGWLVRQMTSVVGPDRVVVLPYHGGIVKDVAAQVSPAMARDLEPLVEWVNPSLSLRATEILRWFLDGRRDEAAKAEVMSLLRTLPTEAAPERLPHEVAAMLVRDYVESDRWLADAHGFESEPELLTNSGR